MRLEKDSEVDHPDLRGTNPICDGMPIKLHHGIVRAVTFYHRYSFYYHACYGGVTRQPILYLLESAILVAVVLNIKDKSYNIFIGFLT